MSHFMHRILKKTAEKILAKQHPKVVAITGSVGKTSSKEAIVAVMQQKFRVRGARKNYNNEIGVPLTIIGADSPGKSKFGWLAVLFRAKKLQWFADARYPKWLVLEMGADHKGDIAYLTEMAHPHIAVVTGVAAAHTEFLGSVEDVAEEKSVLVRALDADGVAVLNGDDPHVQDMRHDTRARVITYGFSDANDVKADGVEMEFPERGIWPRGMTAMLRYSERVVPMVIEGVVGQHALYPALAGAAVGLALGLSVEEVEEGLHHYVAPPGRMRLISGIKDTLLVDDSYNSSPSAALAAVEALAEIEISEGAERYAVLGDMAELGNLAVESHRVLGRRVAELPIDILVTVGELGKEIAKAAREAGMPEHRIVSCAKSDEAGRYMQEQLERGDVVLVKGSQVARMEKIVKELMAEPLRAEELLVRMGADWVDR